MLTINTFIDNGIIDKERYKESLNQERSLLGADQHSWIEQTVSNKFKWSLFGQQLLIGPKYLPALFRDFNRNELPNYLKNIIDIAGANLPYNTDQWDGYPKERERFYKIISKSKSSVVIAGDTHSSWVSNLYSKEKKFVGVELGTPSINSPNFVDVPIFNKNINKLEESFINENKNLQWMDGKNKGYTLININKEFIDTSFIYVSSVKQTQYKTFIGKNFKLLNNVKVIV